MSSGQPTNSAGEEGSDTIYLVNNEGSTTQETTNYIPPPLPTKSPDSLIATQRNISGNYNIIPEGYSAGGDAVSGGYSTGGDTVTGGYSTGEDILTIGMHGVPKDIILNPIERKTLNKWIEESILKSAVSELSFVYQNQIISQQNITRSSTPMPGLQSNAQVRMPYCLIKRMLTKKNPMDKFRMALAINAAKSKIVLNESVELPSSVTIDKVTSTGIFSKYSTEHYSVMTKHSSFTIESSSKKTWFVISYAKERRENSDNIKTVEYADKRITMQDNIYSTIDSLCKSVDENIVDFVGIPVWWDGLQKALGDNIIQVWPAIANIHYISQPVLIVLPTIIDLDKNSVLNFKKLFMRTWPSVERQCSTATNKRYITDVDMAKICAVLLVSMNILLGDYLSCKENPIITHVVAYLYKIYFNDPNIDTITTLMKMMNNISTNGNDELQENFIEHMKKLRIKDIFKYSMDISKEPDNNIIEKYRLVFENIDKTKILVSELIDIIDVIVNSHIIKTQEYGILELIDNKWKQKMEHANVYIYKKVLSIFQENFYDEKLVHIKFDADGMCLQNDSKVHNMDINQEVVNIKYTNIRNIPFGLLFGVYANSDVYCQGDKLITAAVFAKLPVCLQRLLDTIKEDDEYGLHPFKFIMEGETAKQIWRNIDRQSAHGTPTIWKINRQNYNWPYHVTNSDFKHLKKYCWPGFATTPHGDTMLRQTYAILNMSTREADMHYLSLQRDAVDHIVAVAYDTKDNINTATTMWIIYTALFRQPLDHWRSKLGGNNDLLAIPVPINNVESRQQYQVDRFMMLNYVSDFLDDNMTISNINGVDGFVTQTTLVDLSQGGHNSDILLEPLFIVTDYYIVENAKHMVREWLNETHLWIG